MLDFHEVCTNSLIFPMKCVIDFSFSSFPKYCFTWFLFIMPIVFLKIMVQDLWIELSSLSAVGIPVCSWSNIHQRTTWGPCVSISRWLCSPKVWGLLSKKSDDLNCVNLFTCCPAVCWNSKVTLFAAQFHVAEQLVYILSILTSCEGHGSGGWECMHSK